MTKVQIFIMAVFCAALSGGCNQAPKKQAAMTVEVKEVVKDVFPKGNLLKDSPTFSGDAWLQMFVEKTDSFDCTVGNVTFAPGCRNNWHSHPGGQILLCTSGKGYYQEKGKPIRLLNPGDVVKIAPNVVHWHGAAPDSGFTHLAIGTQQEKGSVVWLKAVTDEEYNSYGK